MFLIRVSTSGQSQCNTSLSFGKLLIQPVHEIACQQEVTDVRQSLPKLPSNHRKAKCMPGESACATA